MFHRLDDLFEDLFEKLEERIEKIMADVTELDGSIAQLKADFEAYAAAVASLPVPQAVDVQPQVDAVNAVDSEVKAAQAALNPAPPVP